jgi:hypothetical protein
VSEDGPCNDEWYAAFRAAIDEGWQKAYDAIMPPRPDPIVFRVGDRIEIKGSERFNGVFEVTEVPSERPKPWEPQSFTSRRVHDEETT